MKKFLFLVLMLATLSSCYTTSSVYFIDGKYGLADIHTSSGVERGSVVDGVYSDEYITIQPTIDATNIYLTIANNHASSSMHIHWNAVSFVDSNGLIHGVSRSGVQFVENEYTQGGYVSSQSEGVYGSVTSKMHQAVSVIPAGSMLQDVVAPVDGVEIIPSQTKIMFESKESADNHLLSYYNSDNQEKTTKLLIPIEIDGKYIEYTLGFRGSDFRVCEQIKEDHTPTFLGAFLIGSLAILLAV